MARRSPDDRSATDAGRSGVRRSAVAFCGIAVVALAAAVVVFAVGGPPYASNLAGGALYVAGLLAGLIGAVVLWLAWAEVREDVPPARLGWGVRTATASLVFVSACAVVTLSKVAGDTAQLWLIGATAVVLLAALGSLLGAVAPDA